MKWIVVPLMLFASSIIMALAWLGHLKFKHLGFFQAFILSWILVMPEYLLNVSAIRYGHDTFSGAQMAAFNLASGVLCVALVSKFYLDEQWSTSQMAGFALMGLSMVLIMYNSK